MATFQTQPPQNDNKSYLRLYAEDLLTRYVDMGETPEYIDYVPPVFNQMVDIVKGGHILYNQNALPLLKEHESKLRAGAVKYIRIDDLARELLEFKQAARSDMSETECMYA